MKLLIENWRKLLNEISFDDAKKRLETKALTKWIKGMAFDEETKTMTLNPDQIEAAKNELAKLVLEFVPEDLTDNQKGTTLEWLISVGINDAYMKQKFYNEATASTETDSDRFPSSARADLRIIKNDFERYWQTHDYSDQKDIFSIKSFGKLAVAGDRAKRKYDEAMAEKEYKDPEKGIEVFRDDEKWRIYALHNKGAACHYGKGTEWCTAAPGLDYFEEYYDKEDPLFYFEDKEYGKRWQFHFGSDQFMDEDDNQVDDEERDFFIDLLAKTGAADKYSNVQYWVTKNEVAQTIYDENTTSEELMAIAKKYAGDGEEEIMEMIIDSDNVTKEVLEYIVLNDFDYGANAFSNPKLTDEFINSLAYSEDTHLRYMASYAYDFGDGLRNDALSDEALDKLSEDPERMIRMRIAMHPFAPPETLTKMANRLMKGEAEEERQGAMVSNLLKNDNLPSNLITPLIEWSKTQQNSQMWGKPFDAKIFKDTLAPTAMLAVAQNQNAPAEILGEIGDVFFDNDTGFETAAMHALVTNKNTPKDLLLKLTKHHHPYTRAKAKEALEKLADQTGMESLRENFKRFLK
jgi:hypothetical protein